MAQLTVNDIVAAGLVVTAGAAAAAGGDSFLNDSNAKTFLWVKNASGGAITVTPTIQSANVTVPGFGVMTKASAAVSVAAGANVLMGPYPPAVFNDASGLVQFTYSGVTTLTVIAVRVP